MSATELTCECLVPQHIVATQEVHNGYLAAKRKYQAGACFLLWASRRTWCVALRLQPALVCWAPRLAR